MSSCENQTGCWDDREDTVNQERICEHEQISQSGQQTVISEPKVSGESDLAKHEGMIHEGMVFETEDEAYERYNELARRMGFSVRKNKIYRRADGTVRSRIFVCFREGFRAKDARYPYVKKERKEMRTGCMARMMIKTERGYEWTVSEIVFEHNHPLETPEATYTLRSHRKVEATQASKSESLEILGVHSGDSFDQMTQKVQETNVDCESFLQKKRNGELGEDGASVMLNYFTRKQSENPTFFYASLLDDENHLTNFFWVDAMSVIDYHHFGDVVLFDTTYRTNRYSRPFAIISGVNHHKKTVIFGCAILIDETTESFVWLFDTWMKAMSGKQPKTIITDQFAAVTKAVSIVLPDTHHRLCLGHIFKNAARHLSQLYQSPDFRHVFRKCIYDYETEEEFLSGWENMLRGYKLEKNKWLADLFKIRQAWALVYGCDMFCADATTYQRGKSISRFLKKFVKRKYSLNEGLARYERAIASQRHGELEEECESIKLLPRLFIPTPMLKQAAEKYTRAMFEMFENEYKEHLMCKIEECNVNGTIYKYEISKERQATTLVTIDLANCQVECSCKKFEFVGILCHHIIKVLYHKNIHDIPTQYILKRWTKEAKTEVVRDEDRNPIQADCNAVVFWRYNDLYSKATSIALKGSINEEAYLVAKQILDNGLKEIEVAVRPTQEASMSRSRNTQAVEEVLIIEDGSERHRPFGGRIMSGLESCQREKNFRTEPVYSVGKMDTDHPKKKKLKKGQRDKVLTESESNKSGDPSCPHPVDTPASTFEIPVQDAYSVLHPHMPYNSSQFTQELPELGESQLCPRQN